MSVEQNQTSQVRSAIRRLREMRFEIEGFDFDQFGDEVTDSDEFQELCLELAEEAVDRELQAEAVKLRIDEMTDRKNRLNRTADTLRNIILQCMERKSQKGIQSPALTLSVSNRKKDMKITDESLIPSRFFKTQEPILDKKALRESVLSDGEIVDGVEVIDGSISLTIRRK